MTGGIRRAEILAEFNDDDTATLRITLTDEMDYIRTVEGVIPAAVVHAAETMAGSMIPEVMDKLGPFTDQISIIPEDTSSLTEDE